MPFNNIVIAKDQMRSPKNMFLHGIYISIYSLFKYLSFPFSNYLRYASIRLFAPHIKCTYISDGVTIMFPWRVKIGKSSSLNRGVEIDGYAGVTIGEGVRIASYVTINTADHNFEDPTHRIMEQGYICAPVVIEDDVWIGNHVCINKGITIGKGSIIGSGAVVTKDIPPYSIAVGVPARVIKIRK